MTRAPLTSDRGSTVPLTMFYGALCLVVILLAVAATSLYLERKRLFTIADGAALAAAESFTLDGVSSEGGSIHPVLDSAQVSAAVDDYLAETPTDGLESFAIERAESVDGVSASVTLSAWWRPPVITLLLPQGLRIEVTAVARSVFG